jgi:hypothetical protein
MFCTFNLHIIFLHTKPTSSTTNNVKLQSKQYWLSNLWPCGTPRFPPDLPIQCDGYQQKFNIHHVLECKRGSLLISRHNEIQDKLGHLASSKASFSSTVRDEPKIHNSYAGELKSIPEKQESPAVKGLFQNNRTENHGNTLVRGLWARESDCIIDVRIKDDDAKSQRSKDPQKGFKSPQEREEKEIPQGLPWATLALLSLRGIHGRFTWQGITNLAQETVRAPRWEMGESVLRDLWCPRANRDPLARATIRSLWEAPASTNRAKILIMEAWDFTWTFWDHRNDVLQNLAVNDKLLDVDTIDLAIIEEWHAGGRELIPMDWMQWKGINLETLLAKRSRFRQDLLSFVQTAQIAMQNQTDNDAET